MLKKNLIFAFLLLSFHVFGIDIQVRSDVKTGIKVTENTIYRFQAVHQLSAFKSITVSTPLGNFTEILIPGLSATSEVGSPKLPMSGHLIEVPFNADIQVNILDFSFIDYDLDDLNLDPLIPAQPPRIKSDNAEYPFRYDSIAYATNNFYPSSLVEANVVGISRGLRLGRLQVCPVQYNPVTRVIRVYTDIKFEVIFIHPNIQLTINEKKKNDSPYFKGINNQVLNAPQELDAPLDTIVQYPVKYVIVSPPSFQATLQPFINWKKKKGFTVVEAYTDNAAVGTTTASIKNYLQGLYNAGTASNPAPSFVLFVGDVAQVPSFTGTLGTHPSDLYYCEYTGDYLPEMFYGRFSATTIEQLQPQIDKTLEYEQYLMPDPSFLGYDVMIAGADATYGPTHANAQITYGTSTYFNTAHNLSSHTYLYPNSSSQAAQIRQDVSDGCCFANYTAHGSATGWADPSFQTTHVSAMTNAHKYPLMVGNACLTNKFDNTECFGEALLRAVNKGALGYIGASDNTYWDEDFYWSCGAKSIVSNPSYSATSLGAYDRTFHDHGESYSNWFTTQGQMVYAGNLAVVQGAPSSAGYYWEIYHLMGDPSLSVYYSVPETLNVVYNSILPLSTSSFTINTEPYAYCAISASGVLHGAVQANASGVAVIPITPFSTPVTADVVVTRQNFQPYIGTVFVTNPNAPMCLYVSNTVNDNTGNNNGLLDYGETVQLSLGIQNVGLLAANNVTATISSADAYITIPDNTQYYGTINSMTTSTIPNGFVLTVSNAIPDNHTVNFVLSVANGTETWISNFSLQAHSAVIVYQNNTVSDPTGNNNSKMDPGETVNLSINLFNSGSSQANNLLGTLTSGSSYITINSNNQSFGNVAGGAYSSAIFNVSISPTTPQGHFASFSISITGSNGITSIGNFNLVVGQSSVLIVNWDGNNNAAPAIQSAIEANGVSCQVVTSLPVNLNVYSSLFVCLGIYSDNHVLSASEGTAIAAYLNSGGKVYMEGGETWFYDSQTTAHALFKITGESDGGSDLSTIIGQTSTFTQGQNFTYTGDNNWIDRIAPQSGSTAYTILSNLNPSYGTGVAYNGITYKTIGVSHEFAGLANGFYPSTRNELMRHYLDFFGLVNTELTASFVANSTLGCIGNTVNFTDLSTGNPTSWNWSFPGGSPSTSTLQNPSITYSNTGSYNVSLTVTNANGSQSITKSNYLTINAPPAITTQPVSIIVMETGNAVFSVVALNTTVYQWQYSSNSGVTWYNVTNSGGYSGATTATLTITGVGQSINYFQFRCQVSGNCTPALKSSAATLTVAPLLPIVCTAGTYVGCSGSVSVPVNVTSFYGVAAISLTLTLNGSLLTFVSVSNLNPALQNGSLLVNQNGNTLSISWFSLSVASVGNGTLFNLNFTGNYIGTCALNWDTQTQGNCQFSGYSGNTLPANFANGSVIISGISTPVSIAIAAEPSSPVCAGTPVTYTAAPTNGGNNPVFQWKLNGINTGTGDSWSSTTLQNGDIVTCQLTSSIVGCTLNNSAISNSLTAIVHPNPTLNLGNDTLLPAGSTIILDAGSGSLYYDWSTGATSQTITVTNSGTYSVLATTQFGCSASDTIDITIGITGLSGMIYYDNTLQTAIPGATVSLKQGNTVILSTITNTSGQYSFSETPIGVYTLNTTSNLSWGGVNATDALIILKHFVGLTHLTGIRKTAGDVDNSSAINAIDALATQKRFTNFISSFISGDWAFEKPTIIIDGYAAQTMDVKSLCFGDVNGSYIPTVRFDNTIPVKYKGIVEPSTSSVIQFPVSVNETIQLGAASLIVGFPSEVNILDVKGPSDSREDVIWNVSDGKLYLSWCTLENIILHPDQVLFNLTLQYNNKTKDSPELLPFSINGELASPDAEILSPSALTIPLLFSPSNTTPLLSPNPFQNSSMLEFSTTEDSKVVIGIYGTDNRKIRNVTDAYYPKGRHILQIDGALLPQGLYVLKIETTERTDYLKIIRTK